MRVADANQGLPHAFIAGFKTDMTNPSPARPAIKPPRRPQAERSSDTQARLIEAAITCLHRLGYSGTTVSVVASEAGISRGGMTHQYPTKLDLMLAVVRSEFDEDVQFYDRIFKERPAAEVLADLPSTLWGRLSRPAAMAVTEIMLASRSDPELAVRLRSMQSAIDGAAQAGIAQRMMAAGVRPRADGAAVHRLFVAAVRGLAIDALFMRNDDEIAASIAVLHEVLELLYPDLSQGRA